MNHNPKSEALLLFSTEESVCYLHGKLTSSLLPKSTNEKSLMYIYMTHIFPSLCWADMHVLWRDRYWGLCTERKEAGEGAIEEITLQLSAEIVH